MQIVIDISEEVIKKVNDADEENYESVISWYDTTLYYAIKNSIPLPEGHGRLIDADDIKVIELEDSLHIIHHEKGDEIDVYIDAPTIIEADRSEQCR